MADYIIREAAIERFCNVYCGCSPEECGFKIPQDGAEECAAVRALKEVPAADVRPVVSAHWEWDENGMDWNLGAWKCSHCHCKAETWWATDKHNPLYCAGSHFCGNCGADMR